MGSLRSFVLGLVAGLALFGGVAAAGGGDAPVLTVSPGGRFVVACDLGAIIEYGGNGVSHLAGWCNPQTGK
jgi:hypothetical protein